MADAIYGGATIEATQNDTVRQLQSTMKGYQRQLSHDGVYAVVTLMANDDSQRENPGQEDGEEGTLEKTEQPRKCYIFCPERDRVRLFEELDHKTAAPHSCVSGLCTCFAPKSRRSPAVGGHLAKGADRRMDAGSGTG